MAAPLDYKLEYNLDFSKINLSSLDQKQPQFNLGNIDFGNLQAPSDGQVRYMESTDYKRLEHRDQIYKEADVYIGNVDKNLREVTALNFTDVNNPTFMAVATDFPEGCERLFLEILYNATDNVIESRARNHDVGKIEITATTTTIKIKNGGIPIPIQINTAENKWVPEMIFGILLTSGQYNKTERTGSGKNGYGAKLTNIFSTKFRVSIGNPYDKKHYAQTWESNMTLCHPPVITDGYSGEPYVEVEFEMDFGRFGYTCYSNEVLAMYAAHAAEVSFTLSVPIMFNGVSLTVLDILDYKKLTGFTTENYIVHYEYPPGTELKDKKLPNGTRTQVSVDPTIEPLVKLCLIDTPDEGTFHAFANTAKTKEGGVHVETVYDGLDGITEAINNRVKGKKDDKLNRKQAINKADLKRHITQILCCNKLINPRFTSNEKVKLTHPKPHIKIDEKLLKVIINSNWEMLARLNNDLEAKLNKDVKGNGKRKFLDLDGYDPAYYSGKRGESNKCILYEVEGKSAMGYAYTMKSEMTEQQRDYIGIFAQMGKPLNVMTAKLLTIINSKKFRRFVEAIGLEDGVDYTIPDNFNKLKYGYLGLLNDSDVDGKHITALMLNIIYVRYRSLLRRPFVLLIRTPIIRIEKGTQSFKFYSMAEYQKFMRDHPECEKWSTQYYKGLASTDDAEVIEETRNPRIVYMIYDDTADDAFKLAFSKEKGKTDERKKWISDHILLDGIEELQQLPISHFLNYELVQHAIYNMERTIPRLADGLKPGQRKVIFGTFDNWGAKTGTSTERLKTNHLANHVSKISNYHHGEKSLIDTINRMNLGYPGTNNMRYFVPKGQFGTRNAAGEDAGDARYTFSYPEWWYPYIFRKEDSTLLIMVFDEGKQWEPQFYLTLIPLSMVQGVLGIGTGSSSFIPNFNPLDLCIGIKKLLSGLALGPEMLTPWYRGFKGEVVLKKREPDAAVTGAIAKPLGQVDGTGDAINLESEVHDEPDEPEVIDAKLEDISTDKDGDILEETETIKKKGGLKMVTTGCFENSGKNQIKVTEVPIGKSFKQYDEFLETLLEKKLIKDKKKSCKGDEALFYITGFTEKVTAEALGLVKSYSLTNMVLLDDKKHPVKYSDPNHLLTEWFKWRLPHYTTRKNTLLQAKVTEINDKTMKIKFIQAVLDGYENGPITGRTIVFMKRNRADAIQQMAALGIPDKFLETKSYSYTLDDIRKLEDKINKLYAEYQLLEKTTPEELWTMDIDEFIKVYLKYYPEEKNRVK
jgi:DNA topoisomerase-2